MQQVEENNFDTKTWEEPMPRLTYQDGLTGRIHMLPPMASEIELGGRAPPLAPLEPPKGHQPAGTKVHAKGPSNPVALRTKGTNTQALLAIARTRPKLGPNQHARKPAQHWGCPHTQSAPLHQPSSIVLAHGCLSKPPMSTNSPLSLSWLLTY